MSTSEEGGPNVEDLYLQSYAFTTAAAIVGSVDRKIFVLLRDGRNLFGILRTFDQFANLVIQDTLERIYLDNGRYGETYRGVFLVRGENVVMMGELDIDREDLSISALTQIQFDEAEREWKEKNRKTLIRERERSKAMLKRGLVSDFSRLDMY